ncbi:redoxin domain-containing protein [bacterium]|nr:redoxin domain-containing protein [bacterium]
MPSSAKIASKNSLKAGARAFHFRARNHLGQETSLSELLQSGPVVLSFYRGGWCPFCNRELKELKEFNNRIQALGATIIGIAPEAANKLRDTHEHHNLPFALLVDPGNQIAKGYGVAFQVNKGTAKLYKDKKIVDLSRWNANSDMVLPIPATFLIDQTSLIRYAFVEPDYKKRVPKEKLLEVLSTLKTKAGSVSSSKGLYHVRVKGMTCDGCAEGIQKILKKVEGIKSVDITYEGAGGKVAADLSKISQQGIKEAIEDMGYEVLSILAAP